MAGAQALGAYTQLCFYIDYGMYIELLCLFKVYRCELWYLHRALCYLHSVFTTDPGEWPSTPGSVGIEPPVLGILNSEFLVSHIR